MPKCFSISGTIPRSIAAASSSEGSSTFTTWKRRASAASFSKYFLYSAQVVAAIVRNSPRASAGLSRLAASFCPADPPAPIMVCASSMNRMIGCGLLRTSSITFLSRFSNSPFTLAPACSNPMSSTCSSTPCSTSGTSPSAMRRARPSTTAVLPTPASPVRIGLFWRRRSRMSTSWRISASRPITGSMWPSRARWVRLVVNWSRAGVEDSAPSPPSPPPASAACAAPSAKSTACASSCEPAVMPAKSCLSSSLRIRANCREPRSASCDSSGWVSSASSRCPLRMRVVPASSDASSQACSNSVGRCCENTGVRVLPVRKRSISADRSCSRRPGAMPLRRTTSARSLRGCSIRARNRCSRSTSQLPRAMHRLAARSAAWRQVSLSFPISVLRLMPMSGVPLPVVCVLSLQGVDSVARVRAGTGGWPGGEIAVPAQAGGVASTNARAAHVFGAQHQPHLVFQA